jgi:hypothetical protein
MASILGAKKDNPHSPHLAAAAAAAAAIKENTTRSIIVTELFAPQRSIAAYYDTTRSILRIPFSFGSHFIQSISIRLMDNTTTVR